MIDWYRKKRLPTLSIVEPDANGVSFLDVLAAEIQEALDGKIRKFIYCSITDAIEQLPEKLEVN